MTMSNKPTSPISGLGATEPINEVCKTCPKYITFQVEDAKRVRCVGMYYSVYVEGSGWVVKDGILDAEAKTQTFDTTESGKQASLYIGHRLEDDLPEENVYDEAPLHKEVISSGEQTYTAKVTTARLWKLWSFSSEAAEEAKTEWEKKRQYVYDDKNSNENWDGTSDPEGTLTIGAGHALFTTKEAREWYDRYPPSEAGMTDEEIDALYDTDVRGRARVAELNSVIHVPLYQREFDALIDLRFNAGHEASGYHDGRSNTGQHAPMRNHSITEFLNAGQFTQAGNRILTTANTQDHKWSAGVQNRRNFQRGMFFGEAWQRE